MKVIIKIEGVTPDELAKIHQITDEARVHFPGGTKSGQSFMEIKKSSLIGNRYTLFLNVDTAVGNMEDSCGRRRSKKPSRAALLSVFDTLGILPEEEKLIP